MVTFASGDGLNPARLLDPRLHRLLAPVLGSPFPAGAPDRDTLVLLAGADRHLRTRVAGRIRDDFARAAYPVSPYLFRVSPDGIAAAD